MPKITIDISNVSNVALKIQIEVRKELLYFNEYFHYVLVQILLLNLFHEVTQYRN